MEAREFIRIALAERLTKLLPTKRWLQQSGDLVVTISIVDRSADKVAYEFAKRNFGHLINGGSGAHRKQQSSQSHGLSKVLVARIAEQMSPELAEQFNFSGIDFKPELRIEFSREALLLAARYNKYSRHLPQTPLFLNEADGYRFAGKRLRINGSVQEAICPIVVDYFQGSSSAKFTASGREDVDVRMLGNGRPFALQIFNAKLKRLANNGADLAALTRRVNNASIDIRISDLTVINREQFDSIKCGEEEKRKTYTALCRLQPSISMTCAEIVSRLAKVATPIEVHQLTPVRVMSRRSLATRLRHIFHIDAAAIDQRHFLLRLTTQAGTYVKEFVHSDFGRTRPALADLLSTDDTSDLVGDFDILELDVEDVHMEWPPITSMNS